MTLLNGNGARGGSTTVHSPQLIFQGCFPAFAGPLINAELTTNTAPGPTCAFA